MASGSLGFKLGKKKVYLPNFVLTFIRTPRHPPTFASFIVPLNLNKLDIRDYLYHVYDVRVKSVRSYIQQQKVQQDRPNALIPRRNKFFRPRARKLMTVELERPFVWPEEPENFDRWDKKTYDAAQEYNNEQHKRNNPRESKTLPNPEIESIAEQAKRLLKGKEKWEPRKDLPERQIWVDVGTPREVDADVHLPK